jgi:HD-GYP domain-containing protein (c-di-GMP phosphodiesterase class II)
VARRSDRWDAHPVLAWWVRVAVLLVPLAVSLAVALLVIAVLPDPDGFGQHVLWWAAVVVAAYGAALLVDRYARRALPLAVLLRLSLVFPDQAPSRLRTARRTSLREIEQQVAELHDTEEPSQAARTLVSLVGALGLHDKRTRGHSERVRAYVDVLTEEMGLPEEDRVRLRWAALLHDIGKLSVPGPVLNGGRDLTEEEWAALRAHPDEGDRLAGAMMPWLGEWGRCVREHHERWDGSGYPRGLHGTEISLGARIVAVADAFEVMTANRSYQQAIKATAAREELARCAGKDFDPAVVRAFLQVSLGRLRGVLGPLAFLPALPLATLADRAGRAAQGLTTVAAVTAVALASTAGSPTHVTPFHAAPEPPAVVSPVAEPVPTPTPTPAPTTAAPAPVARRVVQAPEPVVAPASPEPPHRPSPSPAPELGPVLYLAAEARLVGVVSAGGSVTVPHGGWPVGFSVHVDPELQLSGTPRLVVVDRLATRHGNGLPKAVLQVSLLDCGSSCRTLSTGSASLDRSHDDWVRQTIPMSAVDAVVPAGHDLRVTLSLVSHDNVTGLVVGFGAGAPSRLLLG